MHRLMLRRSGLRLLGAVLTVGVLALVGSADPAAADGPDTQVVCDPYTHKCTVVVIDPGDDGSGGGGDQGGGGGGGGGGGTEPVVDQRPDRSDLCTDRIADPQPPASDPAWDGHAPEDGVIYEHQCPFTKDGTPITTLVFVANGDTPPPTVTPLQLAQQAMATLTIPGPTINRSPAPTNRDAGMPYTWVNLPTWYWTARGSWRTQSATASAGDLSATVTVKPIQLVFNPGDGAAAVTCAGPGRPWTERDGNAAPSPSGGGCAYEYKRVSDSVAPTVTIRWVATWTSSAGPGGTLPVQPTSATSAPMRVMQIETVKRS